VGDRAFYNRQFHHIALCLVDALAYRLGNVVGLAEAVTHIAFAVADHRQGGERKAPAALDDLRGAVQLYQLFDKFLFSRFPVAVTVAPAPPVPAAAAGSPGGGGFCSGSLGSRVFRCGLIFRGGIFACA